MGWFSEFIKRDAMQEEVWVAERLAGTPDTTFWSRWFGGILIPVLLVCYGWSCCAHQSATFKDLHLDGAGAIAFGLAWISAGLFAHCHYFWPTLGRLGLLAGPGKTLSLLAFLASLGYLGWWILSR